MPDSLDELFARYGEHLSVDEVAEILGVSGPMVRRWLGGNVIPAYKVSTSWVIYTAEVRDWLREQSNQKRE